MATTGLLARPPFRGAGCRHGTPSADRVPTDHALGAARREICRRATTRMPRSMCLGIPQTGPHLTCTLGIPEVEPAGSRVNPPTSHKVHRSGQTVVVRPLGV